MLHKKQSCLHETEKEMEILFNILKGVGLVLAILIGVVAIGAIILKLIPALKKLFQRKELSGGIYKVETINPVIDWGIFLVVTMLGGSLLGIPFAFLLGTKILGFVVGMLLWLLLQASFGYRVLSAKQYMVVERLGRFQKVYLAGPHVLLWPGFIDKIKNGIGSLQAQERFLYSEYDEQKKLPMIDFQDGSAHITVVVRFTVGERKFIDNIGDEEARRNLVSDILRFTYVDSKPEDRILDIFDAALRPLLEETTLDKAQKERDSLSKSAAERAQNLLTSIEEGSARSAMIDIGAHVTADKGLLITDFNVPQEIQKERRQRLEGVTRGESYALGIEAVQKGLGVTPEEAREIFETQRGLETMEKTGGNVTIFGPTVSEIVKSLLGSRANKGG